MIAAMATVAGRSAEIRCNRRYPVSGIGRTIRGCGDARRLAVARQSVGCPASPEGAIVRHEGFEHVRDQHRRVNRFTMDLRMQRGIAFEIGLQHLGARE